MAGAGNNAPAGEGHSDTSRRQQELLVRSTQAIDKSLAAHCDTVKGALGSIVCEGFGPVGTPFLKCARDVEKSVNSLIDDVDTLAKKSSERIQAAQEALGQKTPPAICAKEDAGPGEAAGKGEKEVFVATNARDSDVDMGWCSMGGSYWGRRGSKPDLADTYSTDSSDSDAPGGDRKKQRNGEGASATKEEDEKTAEKGVKEEHDREKGKDQVKTEVGVEGVLAATPLEFPFPEPTEQAVVKTEQGVQVGAPSKPLLAVVKKEDGSGT